MPRMALYHLELLCRIPVYWTEKGQQEGSSGGVEQHCLPPDSLEEDPCGKVNSHATGTQYPQG